jgi:hypothetical protein
MAATSGQARTAEEVRREIQEERERLAEAVEALREDFGEATDVARKLPVVAAGALGLGFFAAGGIGATMRLILRRGRRS